MIDFIVDLLSGNYKNKWLFFEFWVKFLMENGIRLIIDSQSVMSNKKNLNFCLSYVPRPIQIACRKWQSMLFRSLFWFDFIEILFTIITQSK